MSTTFTLNTESTYDWTNDQWTMALNLMVQQIVKIGDQPIALSLGARYYGKGPTTDPSGDFVLQSFSCSRGHEGAPPGLGPYNRFGGDGSPLQDTRPHETVTPRSPP